MSSASCSPGVRAFEAGALASPPPPGAFWRAPSPAGRARRSGSEGPACRRARRRIDDVVAGAAPISSRSPGCALLALVSGAGMWAISSSPRRRDVASSEAPDPRGIAGMPWRESLTIGLLMNTRGLMELVILGVGLDIGIISPTLFAMMVLMALTTTVMAAPCIQLLQRPGLVPSAEPTTVG